MAKKRKSRTPQPEPEPQQEQPQPTVDDVITPDPDHLIDQNPQQDHEQEQQEQEEEQEEEEELEEEEQEEEEEEEEEEENPQQGNEVKTEEEETEELEDEPVEKLLEPFSKEQLVLLLKEAVIKHPELIESVQKIADIDPAHRKIFVHGLGWDTTTEVLINEYGKYGEIEDCKHVVDKVSGKSKGYAFILYKHRVGAQKALKEPQKKIGNRVSSCQLASAGPVVGNANAGSGNVNAASVQPVSEYTQRKIFVSNVAADIEPGKLLEFFEKFGEVEDGPLGLDKQTGKPRGFALFVYKSVESAKKALEEPHKIFEGHTLHCQKAVDGPKPNKPFFQSTHQQYGGGGGGHHYPSKKSKYSNSGGGGGLGHGHGGHLMAPSGPSVGYNPAVPPALTPVLGQALTALLASQGGGLGNLLGLGGAPQGMPPAGYGAQPGMQGGYANPQAGQGGGRTQQGGAPYMGHGR